MELEDLIDRLCHCNLFIPLLVFLICEHILLLLSAVFIYYTLMPQGEAVTGLLGIQNCRLKIHIIIAKNSRPS